VPSLLIYVAAGLTGMHLLIFLALDIIGTLLCRPDRRPGVRGRQTRRGRCPPDRPLLHAHANVVILAAIGVQARRLRRAFH